MFMGIGHPTVPRVVLPTKGNSDFAWHPWFFFFYNVQKKLCSLSGDK